MALSFFRKKKKRGGGGGGGGDVKAISNEQNKKPCSAVERLELACWVRELPCQQNLVMQTEATGRWNS
jgi:hypothetical protein